MTQGSSTAVFGAGTATYRSICTLARGGMGRVDLCVRKTGSFERLYAIKRLHPHLQEEETMRSMFLDEARVAGLVRHANVVSVLDVGDDGEGPYLVMDYVEGVSLSRLIGRQVELGRPLPIALCARIMAQVARGLHAAHELSGPDGAPLGLVHRDVSPQNILIGRDGVVRVTDFGIAKTLGGSSHTRTGLLKGKVGYMSPEALRFEPVDRRSDLFALGVVLYELARMRRLYKGEDAAAVARRILGEVPPDLGEERADAPPELVELVFELLAKDREDRPATAGEVADRLEAIAVEYDEDVDLRGYLAQTFGEALEAERERIRDLVERAEDPTTLHGPNGDSGSVVVPARSRAPWVAVAGLVVAGGVAAVLWPWGAPDAEGSTDAPTVAADVEGASVTLRVQSRPPHAKVSVGDEVVGQTPTSFELPRGEAPVVVVISHDGYEPTGHRLTPDRDQDVFVALTPAAEPALDDKDEQDEVEPSHSSTKRPRKREPRGARRKAEAKGDDRTEPTPQFRKFD